MSARVELRLLGETIPDRVMAFAGDGSGQVAVEVGTRVRDRDKTYAVEQAVEVAIDEALTTGLRKLKTPQKRKR